MTWPKNRVVFKSWGELAIYYRRKIAEGKHALKVINAIRNKPALRIAAVINNKEPHNENYISTEFAKTIENTTEDA